MGCNHLKFLKKIDFKKLHNPLQYNGGVKARWRKILCEYETEREGEQDSRRECERVGESARENKKCPSQKK
jgi:hypothetical protein